MIPVCQGENKKSPKHRPVARWRVPGNPLYCQHACPFRQAALFLCSGSRLFPHGAAALGFYEEFRKNHFRVLQAQDPSFLESTLRRILSLTIKKDLHSEVLVSKLITEIITQLIIESSTENTDSGSIPEYIRTALKEIEIHFYEPLNLDQLAKSLGISKFHFSRQFKKYIGITPNDYLTLMRINHAKALLKDSKDSIEDIAVRCGFHYAGHFINQFRKLEGITPLQYRKAWNEYRSWYPQ